MQRLEDLNFHHLFYFWVAATEGSVTAASRRLGLAQPSVSAQIRKLETALGGDLFDQNARGRRLTDLGREVFEHAERVFGAGQGLVDFLNGRPTKAITPLIVGVPDVMPKLLTFRLLQHVVESSQAIVRCHASRFDELVSDLAVNRFDVVLSHSPIGSHMKVRAFNHKLGETGVSFFATSELADRVGGDFPGCLDGAPMLAPIEGAELRRSLEQWFEQRSVRPRIVAEVHDSALLKEFGAAGYGVFAAPTVIEREISDQYRVRVIGRTADIRDAFYALTTQKRIVHPAVAAIVDNARTRVFDQPAEVGESGSNGARQSAITN